MAEKIHVEWKNKEAYYKWLDKIKKGTGDARPLWKAMTPKIIEFVNHQFSTSGDSGKGWKRLKSEYKAWKVKKGYSPFIGVRTGKLKIAAGVGAQKKATKTFLTWQVRNSIATEDGTAYAEYFDRYRKIYKNVSLRVNSFLTLDIRKFPDHAGFTYNWLKNSLNPKV